jgi:uncharacterized protein (DUF2249 family)
MSKPTSDKPQATDITPETKIGVLLDKFPQLEAVLLELSPTFARLKNPLLRKTVAKVADLRQVAQIGNMPVAELIQRLRQEAGIQVVVEGEIPASEDESAAITEAPAWVKNYKLHKSLDARPIIEGGGRPLETVMADLEQLQAGEKYELINSFVPAPLIEIARNQGFQAWTHHETPSVVRTFFSRG